MKRVALMKLSLLATAFSVSNAAWGQDAAGVSVGDDLGGDIVVTARRREESIQDVPVSVTALSAEAIENRSIQDLTDLSRVSPGIRFGSEGGKLGASVSLRGLAQTPISNSTPGVVTYFAEVPLPSEGSNVPTFDIGSIQVLKGPQGTLFGRTTLGGAVLIAPAAPTHNFEGYAEATYGSFDYVELEGALNLPLGDVAAIRVAGQMRRRDGTTRRIDGGGYFDNIHQDSARVSLLLEPIEGLRNTTIFSYYKQDENATANYLWRVNTAFPGFGPLLAAPFAQQQQDYWASFGGISGLGAAFNENWSVINKTDLELSDTITVRNILGYRETHTYQLVNTGAVPSLPLGPGFTLFSATSDTYRKQLTEEFQVQADFGSVDAVAGVFYSRETPNGASGSAFKAFSADPVPRVFGTNLFYGESFAVYAQLGIELTDQLSVDIGGRYTWETAEACGGTFSNGAGGTEYVGSDRCLAAAALNDPTDGFGKVQAKSDDYNYTLAINYKPSDDILLYATTRRGVRPSAVNVPLFETRFTTGGSDPTCQFANRGLPPGVCADLRPFQTTDVEVLTDYEVGLKSQIPLGSGVLRLNLAGFYNDYKNSLQLLTTTPGLVPTAGVADTPSRGGVAVNVADLTIWGIELDTAFQPSRNFTFSFSGAYNNSKVDRVNIPAGGFSYPASLVTLPTPKLTGTAAVEWILPVRPMDGELVFNGDIFFTDDFSGQSGINLPGYMLANARLDLRNIGGSGLDLGVFVRNLTNERYFTGPGLVSPTQPVNTVFRGDPRTWNVSLRYRFGS